MSYANPCIDPTAGLSREILDAALKAGYGRPVVNPNTVTYPAAAPAPEVQPAAGTAPKAP